VSFAVPTEELPEPDGTTSQRAVEVIPDPPRQPETPTGTPTELAARFGLHPIGLRPPIPEYLRQVWARRHFVIELSRAREHAANAESRLGQFWQVLNPLLNVGVYYLIFGVLLGGARAVPNFIAWLVIGVFTFTYTQNTMLQGSKSISTNLGIVRALHFPRVLMPLAVVVEEVFTLGTSLLICLVVVLATGEGIHWQWILLIPAVGLQTLFVAGLAMTFARITERVRDVAQLLPFLARTWMYLSGVVFSLQTYGQHLPERIQVLLNLNPGAIYVELTRTALLHSQPPPPWYTWPAGVAWALIALIGGFIYFWKAEERYGRG
jgi:teichoic acid transport system permease protein